MRSQAKAVCWRAAGLTVIGLVSIGFVVSVVAGA